MHDYLLQHILDISRVYQEGFFEKFGADTSELSFQIFYSVTNLFSPPGGGSCLYLNRIKYLQSLKSSNPEKVEL